MSDSEEDGVVIVKPQDQENTVKEPTKGVVSPISQSTTLQNPQKPIRRMVGGVASLQNPPQQKSLDQQIREAERNKEAMETKFDDGTKKKIANMVRGIEKLKEEGQKELAGINQKKLNRGKFRYILKKSEERAAKAEEMEKQGKFGPDNPGADKWRERQEEINREVDEIKERGEVVKRTGIVQFAGVKVADIKKIDQRMEKKYASSPLEETLPETSAPKPAFTHPRPRPHKVDLPPVQSRLKAVGPEALATQTPKDHKVAILEKLLSLEDMQQLDRIKQQNLGAIKYDVSSQGRKVILSPIKLKNQDQGQSR